MDYKSFIANASFEEIGNELARLADEQDSTSLENISLFLADRSDDTFMKHEIPRLACRALIQHGANGISRLASILREIEGFIYPTTVIRAIWYASQGAYDPSSVGFVPRVISLYPTLNKALAPETIIAAKNAFYDIIISGFRDPERFDKLSGFLYHQSIMPTDYSLLMSCITSAIADSSIKISKKQIDDFDILINSNAREEDYQLFLENNPVFINPLANKVIDKHKLGDDLITDFIVQTLSNSYILIEIEKPQDKIFNSKSDFSAAFIHAYGQTLDFIAWIDSNIAYAQTKLPSISSPTGLVIIGRRQDLTPSQNNKLEYFNKNSQRITILTYDDVISNARVLYNNIVSDK